MFFSLVQLVTCIIFHLTDEHPVCATGISGRVVIKDYTAQTPTHFVQWRHLESLEDREYRVAAQADLFYVILSRQIALAPKS